MRQTKAEISIPHSNEPSKSVNFHPKSPNSHQNSDSVSPIQVQLTKTHQQLMDVKAKSKDLAEKIERMQRENRKLEELHFVNQEVIVKNEKELAGQRGSKPNSGLNKQKETLETALTGQTEKLNAMIQSHFGNLEETRPGTYPEGHKNKVIELMLTQMRIFQTQIEQKNADLLLMVERYQKQKRNLKAEISGIRGELRMTSEGRLGDMKQMLKLVRTEAYTAETIRNHGLRPTNEIAAEATVEVIGKLKEKLEPLDENQEFLKSLQGKLKRRGINLEL